MQKPNACYWFSWIFIGIYLSPSCVLSNSIVPKAQNVNITYDSIPHCELNEPARLIRGETRHSTKPFFFISTSFGIIQSSFLQHTKTYLDIIHLCSNEKKRQFYLLTGFLAYTEHQDQASQHTLIISKHFTQKTFAIREMLFTKSFCIYFYHLLEMVIIGQGYVSHKYPIISKVK